VFEGTIPKSLIDKSAISFTAVEVRKCLCGFPSVYFIPEMPLLFLVNV
jgi:hypothetical protein